VNKVEEKDFDLIEKDAIDPGRDAIIGPGYDFGKVTDKIGNIPCCRFGRRRSRLSSASRSRSA
jgi:hypothetical protein